MTFHAYPIEWAQFIAATIAMLVHAVGIWDAWLTYAELRASSMRHQQFLRILAAGGVRTAMLRFCQQGGIFAIGVIGIMEPPPPIFASILHSPDAIAAIVRNVAILRGTLVVVSALSVVKEVWAMFDRHRSLESWKTSNAPAVERRARPRE